jgi:hypothetical protein
MKTQINEIKRMQQLAGLITENEEDEFQSYKNDFEPIKDDTSNIQPGDAVVGANGYFGEFKGINNKGKYVIIYDAYGERGVYSKDNFIKYFQVQKK